MCKTFLHCTSPPPKTSSCCLLKCRSERITLVFSPPCYKIFCTVIGHLPEIIPTCQKCQKFCQVFIVALNTVDGITFRILTPKPRKVNKKCYQNKVNIRYSGFICWFIGHRQVAFHLWRGYCGSLISPLELRLCPLQRGGRQ